jgi:hypothetical protein
MALDGSDSTTAIARCTIGTGSRPRLCSIMSSARSSFVRQRCNCAREALALAYSSAPTARAARARRACTPQPDEREEVIFSSTPTPVLGLLFSFTPAPASALQSACNPSAAAGTSTRKSAQYE